TCALPIYLPKIEEVHNAVGYRVDRNSNSPELKYGTFDTAKAMVRVVDSPSEFQENQVTGAVYYHDVGSGEPFLSAKAETFFADRGISKPEAERILEGIIIRDEYTTATDKNG